MASRRQWQGESNRMGGAALVLLIAAGLLIGLLGVGQAKAKPAGNPAPPDKLTLRFKMEPMPPLAEPIPGAITEGRAYYGKLTSVRPACQRGRVVYAQYEFPNEPGSEPLIRPMWGDGGARVKTDGRGFWKAEPVVFARMALRVTAFVKPKPAGAKPCPMIESRPLNLPPQMPPMLFGRINTATGSKAERPIPVTLTVQAKSAPQVYCPECIRFSGRISSPKAACRSHRVLGNALRYRSGSPNAGRTFRDPHFAESDGRGRWSIVVSSSEPLAWMEVTVPKERVGNALCQAARGKVTL